MNLLKGLQDINQYKTQAQRAKEFARKRQLREAVKIANYLIDSWASLSQWEQKIWRLQIETLPEELSQQYKRWQANFKQASQIFERAVSIQYSDQGDPTQTETLMEAMNLYQSANDLLNDSKIKSTLRRCQREIARRQHFNNLLNQAKQQAQQRYFKEAYEFYQKAKELYTTPTVQEAIANCQLQITQEEQYLKKLQQVRQIAQSGQFGVAFKLLKSLIKVFPRSDGEFLLKQLSRVLKGKQHFNAGLLAEQQQDLQAAEAYYRQSKEILPEFSISTFRLGIVAVKAERFADAIQALEKVRGKQATYVRGFAYAKQNAFQQAQEQWQLLTTYPQVQAQSKILNQIEHRQKLQVMSLIEQDVDNNNLNVAKGKSQLFLTNFGHNSIVKSNLENHIQASLIANQWKTNDWQQIYTIAEQLWSETFNIETLHNWFVAAFYYAQADNSKLGYQLKVGECGAPRRTPVNLVPLYAATRKLLDLIIAGSMALANLESDPSLKDIPWQANKPVNLAEFRTTVTELIGSLVDAVREQDMQDYLRLRDAYRVEVLALKQINSAYSVRFYDLYFTPGCYSRYQDRLPELSYPPEILGTLYTPWGSAVAACLDGDSVRAQAIKPNLFPSKPIEIFADHLISYYQGCDYLQNQKWKLAVSPLSRAKPTIQKQTEWQEEIDRLCVAQRQQISEDDEHIKFAQFWYELLTSKASASYLAEYKARRIREQFSEDRISLSNALKQAKDLISIDRNNPVVSTLINDFECLQEMEEVVRLLDQNRFDDAVRYAKRSRHDRVRTGLMEFFIKIIVEGMKSGRISGDELHLLGRWAYELDPYCSELQALYRILRL